MRAHLLAGALAALCSSLALAQDEPQGNVDYPTIERVQFVEFCVREHPDRSRQEMLYKCSCAMDKIIAQLPYDDYVEGLDCLLRRSDRRRARCRCAREHGRTHARRPLPRRAPPGDDGLPGQPVSCSRR